MRKTCHSEDAVQVKTPGAPLGTRTIQERGPANAGPLQRSSEKTPQNTLNSTLPITVKRAEARAPVRVPSCVRGLAKALLHLAYRRF